MHFDLPRSALHCGATHRARFACHEPDHARKVVPNSEARSRPEETPPMIRKLSTGKYRLYSRKINQKTGRRRNLGTFGSRAAAEKHERAVQYFKRH